MQKLLACFLLATVALAQEPNGWRSAEAGYQYTFPRDHGSHPDFKTEWWYVTGNLRAQNGRDFGFQLTFFRQGIRPPGQRPAVRSRFVQDHFYFSHFALSDLAKGNFQFDARNVRAAFNEAGATEIPKPGEPLAWNGDWNLRWLGGEKFDLSAAGKGAKLELTLESTKPLVTHGYDGISVKGEGTGQASHYYSATRLSAQGKIRLPDTTEAVPITGLAWLDREWSTSVLGADQLGWNWWSLHFDDGCELMLYQMRRNDGSMDPASSGTWITKEGKAGPLGVNDFKLTPGETWKSPATGGLYPTTWRVEYPAKALDIRVIARMKAQELVLPPVTYWEGAVKAEGTHPGSGYLEMTGYAGKLEALQRK